MLGRAGQAAGFDMKIHPHMLRHACGFKLANDGVDTRTIQAYLGNVITSRWVFRRTRNVDNLKRKSVRLRNRWRLM